MGQSRFWWSLGWEDFSGAWLEGSAGLLHPATEGVVGWVQPRTWGKWECDSVCTSVREQGGMLHREEAVGQE